METGGDWVGEVDLETESKSRGKYNENKYKDASIGVINEGSYADLLLVDGNPLDDVAILTKPEQNLKIIIKDGKIYKNTL